MRFVQQYLSENMGRMMEIISDIARYAKERKVYLGLENMELRPFELVYTVEDLRITMTEDFEDIEPEGYDRVLQKGMCVAMFMEEPFTNLEGMEELSVEEYYSFLRFYNSAVSQSLTEQGITYVQSQYQNPETGILWHYMLVAYKGTDAFWLVEFAVPENKWEEMKPELLKWAASVEITP